MLIIINSLIDSVVENTHSVIEEELSRVFKLAIYVIPGFHTGVIAEAAFGVSSFLAVEKISSLYYFYDLFYETYCGI
jgi:hypothetical protein